VGNLTGYTDTVMGTWGLSYDSLNRLSLGTQTPGGGSQNSSPESFCWTYDDFGNRTTQMVAESTSAGQLFTNAPGAASCQLGSSGTLISNDWANYAGNNRIASTNARGLAATPVYDAAGNVTFDGQNYYWYDAEGRVCATQSYATGYPGAWGYLYDADGNRVAKGRVTPSPQPSSQPISCDPTQNGFQFTENYVLGPWPARCFVPARLLV
jgi:YD repeat-containing protein